MELKKGSRIRVFYRGTWYIGRFLRKGSSSFPYVEASFKDGQGRWRRFCFRPGLYEEAPEPRKACPTYARDYCYNRIPDNEMCDRCVTERKGKGRAHYRPFKHSTSKRMALKRGKRKRTIEDQKWKESELKRRYPDKYKKMFGPDPKD